MATLSNEELARLVKEFQSLESHEKKCEFLWAKENAELQRVISVIHFPKPETKPA
jgi:hypothetical protein